MPQEPAPQPRFISRQAQKICAALSPVMPSFPWHKFLRGTKRRNERDEREEANKIHCQE